MNLTVSSVTAGTAHAALASAVAEAKSGDPLRPVTVVVPTNAAGVMARRQLGRLGGVAAVDFVTVFRLAERLAGPALRAEQRLPVSTAVVDVAVRAVLAEHHTAFDAVRDHPSTVVALRDIHRELRAAGPEAVARLERASRRGADVARVSRLVNQRLALKWYDEGDLLTHAAAVVGEASGEPRPPLVVFLPQVPSPLELSVLRALGERSAVHVLLGLSGDRDADADVLLTASALGAVPPAPVSPTISATAEVVSVTDADEEVRHAVREVVAAARAGTPLAGIAILWPTDRPYARLVEHHLDAAGIAWNGRPGTTVRERVVPRFLLDLLDVDRRGLRRRDLFDLLADVPVRDPSGRPTPVALWERASREAGVVKDEQWTPRLRAYAARQQRRAARLAERDDGDHADPSATATSPTAAAAEQLVDFVADLRRDLGWPTSTRTWGEWADWSVTQIETRLGTAMLADRGEAEYQAWEHTIRVLDRLRHLDAIGGPATRTQFRSVFSAEFDVAPGRLGRIGTGVTVGSLAGAVGLVAELAIVVGAADGLMPAPPSIDPLLSDGDRGAAGLPTSTAVTHRSHRQLLGLLDSVERILVTTPRGDLRTTTTRQPSRWLSVLGEPARQSVASHARALLDARFPANPTEHRLRTRSVAVLAGGSPSLTALAVSEGDSVLTRGLTLRRARAGDALTVFDGDLSNAGVPSFAWPVSPTQLQTWTSCPHAYFVQYLLGVRPIEEPGDELAITAPDRGNVFHDTLDLFHREVIAGDLPQPDQAGWTTAHAVRLAELLSTTAEQFERSGRTGRAAYWEIDRKRLWNELFTWMLHDSELAIARRSRVVASEQRFGADGEVTLALGGGRSIAVLGTIDRIDRTATGLVVTDHKSGAVKSFKDIDRADPTSHGTQFQLPAYAAAATVIAGEHTAAGSLPVRAEYSFLHKGGYRRIGYELDTPVWDQVAADLGHVVSGIEAGWFPAIAVKPQFQVRVTCAYCDPDSLGTAERFAEWERKRADPRLHTWFTPDAEAPDEGDE